MFIPDWLKTLAGAAFARLLPRGAERLAPGLPWQAPAPAPANDQPREPEAAYASPASVPDAETAARGWSKSISDCHELLRLAFPPVNQDFCAAHPDCTLKVDYTWRSPALQFELFKKGRAQIGGRWVVVDKSQVVTDKDGTDLSHHNIYPAAAADIYIVQGGRILWPDSSNQAVCSLYTELGHMWEQRGLISGATWKYTGFHDWDHVQVGYKLPT